MSIPEVFPRTPTTAEMGPKARALLATISEYDDFYGILLDVLAEARAPLDVNVLRDAARRSGMPINVTVADIENLAREYDSGVRYWDGKDAALEEPTP